MNALPSFVQVQPTGQTAPATSLSLLSGEGGKMANFNALVLQNAALPEQGEAASAEPIASSGEFQDVNVILQLLRTSQSGASQTAMGAAPIMAAQANPSLTDMTQPQPQPQTLTQDGMTPPLPAAEIPAASESSQPVALPFNAAALSTASAHDLLDMAARLAAMPSGETPSESAPQPAPALPMETAMGHPSTADLQAAMQKLIADQPSAAPAPIAAPTSEAPVADTQGDDSAKQTEGLDILLSLSVSAAPIAPLAVALVQAAAPQTAQANSTPKSEDGLEPLMTSAATKPQQQSAAPAPQAKSPKLALPTDTAPAAPAQARAPAPLPSAAIAAAIAAPAPVVPLADAGPAMAVLITTPTHTAGAAPLVSSAAAAAPLSEYMLDMTSDDAWIEQLAKDIAATKSQTGDLSFRLMPRHLGRLDVSMMHSDQGVSVYMDAQQENTAAIVAAAQSRLVDELRQQGVRVASAETTHTPQENMRQNSQGQGRASQNHVNHLIETASEPLPESNGDDKGRIDHHGRFA